MSDTIGDDPPPSHRGRVLVVVAAVLLAVLGVARLLDPPPAERQGHPAGATGPPQPATAAPTSPEPSFSTQPADAATPAADPEPLPPPPWHDLPLVTDVAVDHAVMDHVVWQSRSYRLERGERALTMDGAANGPVLLVQSRGTVRLEQLRPDGSRLVLEAFHDDSRLPQGIAVDPTGRRVVYAVTNGAAGDAGRYGLVVRSLLTGRIIESRRTRLPFAVRGWVASGVVLEVAMDPGGPPYRWTLKGRVPEVVTSPTGQVVGPFLLAASPVSDEWLLYGDGCTSVLRSLGGVPRHLACPELHGPAVYSPSGERVAGLGYRPVLRILDPRTGASTRLAQLRRVFVSQLVWQDDRTLQVAVHTLADDRGTVLECRVGAGCSRVALGGEGRRTELVLAE